MWTAHVHPTMSCMCIGSFAAYYQQAILHYLLKLNWAAIHDAKHKMLSVKCQY